MDTLTTELISPEVASSLVAMLDDNDLPWLDGRLTAGSHAAEVKRNRQLDPCSQRSKQIIGQIQDRITQSPLIKSWCLIRRVHSLILSASTVGDGYGWHVDNPFSKHGRRDLSFTLFLSDPEAYSGGSLSIQSSQDTANYRLPQGQMIIYPSSALHCVEPILSGTRYVCVGWIESYVQSAEDRMLLFNLDSASRGLLARHGRSSELDLIFQVYSNALRRLSS